MTSPSGGKTLPTAGLTFNSQVMANQAQNQLQNVYASNPYNPTQSAQTLQAINGITNIANQNSPLLGSAGTTAQNIMATNGKNATTQSGLDNIRGIANGTVSPTAISQYLTKYANGSMVGNNADFKQMLQNQDNTIANNVNLNASMGGRYGSGAYQGLLTNQLAQNDTAANAAQYNQDVANQMSAAQALSGEQQNGITNRLNASNAQIGAGQTANSQLLQAAQLAPDLYQAQTAPYGLLAQIGAQQDAFQQAKQLAPVENLQNYANLWSQIGQPFVNLASQTAKGASPLQTGLGMASSAAGILGAL